LVPRADARPPPFRFVVALYRQNLLFRALTDLAIVGAVVVAVAADWTAVRSWFRSAPLPVTAPTAAPAPSIDWNSGPGPGAMTIDRIRIRWHDPTVERSAMPANRLAVDSTFMQLLRGSPTNALHTIERADPDDPVVAYAEAIVRFNLGPGETANAERLLHRAADAALPQAFVKLGELAFTRALLASQEPVGAPGPESAEAGGDVAPATEREAPPAPVGGLLGRAAGAAVPQVLVGLGGLVFGGPPPGEGQPVSVGLAKVDTAGNVIQTTQAELLKEAVEWWQRAATLGSPEAQRLLGMAEARGLTGTPNSAAALALWEDAAARSDVIAQYEAGSAYLAGFGAPADFDQAAAYFRQAADDFIPALIGLVAALAPRTADGDLAATEEAFAVLDRLLEQRLPAGERAKVQRAYAAYLMQLVPAQLRDPVSAVDHLIAAVTAGDRTAAGDIGNAYRVGLGRQTDLVTAYAYYLVARQAGDETVDGHLASLEADLTPDERRRGRDLAFKIGSPGNLHPMREFLRSLPDDVEVQPRQPSPAPLQ